MEIKGVLGRLYAKADRINLSKEQVTLNTIDLSDTAITLLLNDTTTKADTTSTPVNWILKLEKSISTGGVLPLQMLCRLVAPDYLYR